MISIVLGYSNFFPRLEGASIVLAEFKNVTWMASDFCLMFLRRRLGTFGHVQFVLGLLCEGSYYFKIAVTTTLLEICFIHCVSVFHRSDT